MRRGEGQIKEGEGQIMKGGAEVPRRGREEGGEGRKEGRGRGGEGRGGERDGTLHLLIKLTNEHSQKTQHSTIVGQGRGTHSSPTSDYSHKGVAQSRLAIR